MLKGSYLIEDQPRILLLDLKHNLVSGVSRTFWLNEHCGRLLVNGCLVARSCGQLYLPVELADTASVVAKWLGESADDLGRFILPEGGYLLLVVILANNVLDSLTTSEA